MREHYTPERRRAVILRELIFGAVCLLAMAACGIMAGVGAWPMH